MTAPVRSPRTRANGSSGRRLHQLPVAVVLAVLVTGLVTVMLHHFRRGGDLVGLSLVIAAALRLVLSPRRAGLLVVRSRALDVAVLAVLGIGIMALTQIVPVPKG